MSRKSLVCILGFLLMLAGNLVSAEPVARRVFRQEESTNAPSAKDLELQQKLTRELNGERNTQRNLYDYFTVTVRDRVATISGYARDYPARNEALDTARSLKGIESAVDNIRVLPVSAMDDRIREAVALNIFEQPGMGKYWLNPFHPIRIIVNGGNVILEGVVMDDLDRQLAYTGANYTPGVFSVTNNLKVDPKLTGFEGH